MKLLKLHITPNSLTVNPGWSFFKDGTLIIDDSSGNSSYFGKVYCPPPMFKRPKNLPQIRTIIDGFLKSNGVLISDRNVAKNTDKALLFISAEGKELVLPENLFQDYRVIISPIVKGNGKMSAAVICLLEGENVDIVLENKTVRIRLKDGYVETSHVLEKETGHTSFWTFLKKEFRRCAYNFFHPHRAWRPRS